MTFPSNPVYLVELFGVTEGGLETADVSGELALALQAVYWHLKGGPDSVSVKVSTEDDGKLQGIAFLRTDETLLATITVYSLDQEQSKAAEHVPAVHTVANIKDLQLMETQLNLLF